MKMKINEHREKLRWKINTIKYKDIIILSYLENQCRIHENALLRSLTVGSIIFIIPPSTIDVDNKA